MKHVCILFTSRFNCYNKSKNREALACDAIAISDTGMAADGYPTLSYALRGIATMEVKVYGPSHDLHSGIYGGAVANPATAAARSHWNGRRYSSAMVQVSV